MRPATLVWEPAEKPRIIPHSYGENAIRALESFFGPYPMTLRPGDLPVLKALHIASGQRPLFDIMKLIERHGAIRLWPVASWSFEITDETIEESRAKPVERICPDDGKLIVALD